MPVEYLSSLVRLLLVAVGSWLATKGYPTIDENTAGKIAGAVVVLGSGAWSYFNARQKNQLKQDKVTLKAVVEGELDPTHPAVTEILTEPVKKSDPEPPPAMPPTPPPTRQPLNPL